MACVDTLGNLSKITVTVKHPYYSIIGGAHDMHTTQDSHTTLERMLKEYNEFEYRMLSRDVVVELAMRRDTIFKFIKDNKIMTKCYMKNYKLS